MSILSRTPDRNTEARERLFDVAPPPPAQDRHWFVPDELDGVFCRACALPRYNVRHVARPGGEAA